MSRHALTRSAILGLSFFGLGACSTIDSLTGNDGPPPPCPNVSILADAERVTRFAPGARADAASVVHKTEMDGFLAGCEYDLDDTGQGTVVIELAPNFTSSLGPANQSGRTDVQYFVGLMNPHRQVVTKSQFSTGAGFPENVRTIAWTDPESVSLTIPVQAGEDPLGWRVIIGLQLTRDELNANRQGR